MIFQGKVWISEEKFINEVFKKQIYTVLFSYAFYYKNTNSWSTSFIQEFCLFCLNSQVLLLHHWLIQLCIELYGHYYISQMQNTKISATKSGI